MDGATAQGSSAAAGLGIEGRRGGVVAREAIPLLKQFPYTRQLSQVLGLTSQLQLARTLSCRRQVAIY